MPDPSDPPVPPEIPRRGPGRPRKVKRGRPPKDPLKQVAKRPRGRPPLGPAVPGRPRRFPIPAALSEGVNAYINDMLAPDPPSPLPEALIDLIDELPDELIASSSPSEVEAPPGTPELDLQLLARLEMEPGPSSILPSLYKN